MRFLVFLFLSISLLFAQFVDPYLTHQTKRSLYKKAGQQTIHILVKGERGIGDRLFKHGFDVQSDLGEFATVSLPTSRLNDLEFEKSGKFVREVAIKLSQKLGYSSEE